MGAATRRRAALGAAYGAAPAWAWHYTLGISVPQILGDQQLWGTWEGASVCPAVWFTTAERPDPTSCAALTLRDACRGDARRFKATVGGFWRFGVPADHPLLQTYGQVLAAHPPGSALGRHIRQLDPQGANRNQWRLAFTPVPLAGCRVEELLGDQWEAHTMASLIQTPDHPGYGLPGLPITHAPERYWEEWQ